MQLVASGLGCPLDFASKDKELRRVPLIEGLSKPVDAFKDVYVDGLGAWRGGISPISVHLINQNWFLSALVSENLRLTYLETQLMVTLR